MEILQYVIGLLQNPSGALAGWIATMGAWAYAPVFLIVFIETGVVVMPFLPGDSLLFAAGVLTGSPEGGFSLPVLLGCVWAAAILGDQCNYAIGRFFGRRIVASGRVRALTPERTAKAEALLGKYGALAIFLGRFIPFARTLVPFLAGAGNMRWRSFAVWNAAGAVVWSSLFIFLGRFFGGIPFVQAHFELVIVLIVAVSAVPVALGAVRAWVARRQMAQAR